MLLLDDAAIEDLLDRAFDEDLENKGDITTLAVVDRDASLVAVMRAREDMVVAGLDIAARAFYRLDPDAELVILKNDGDRAKTGETLLSVKGSARSLLTAERTALNIVQHLSGIATLTRRYVDAVEGTGATLLDTRKTHAGLRRAEKYATRMGGANNHRIGLFDAVMIKDNHLAVAGGVQNAMKAARAAGHKSIEVECDTLEQVREAITAGADRLLLDNMAPPMLREALAIIDGRAVTEASGGVNLKNIRAIAETGVDYISVGRITQSAPAIDIGLDFDLGANASSESLS